MKDAETILSRLRTLASPENAAGMARYGINTTHALGIPVSTLRALAKPVRAEVQAAGERHALAAALWDSGVHEARILAGILDDPHLVTEAQMETWAASFDSWDLVDQTCSNLFSKASLGYAKALEWSVRPEEFIRRAGFSLMAAIAVHDQRRPADDFEPFFTAILAQAGDERNYVKKAVNWALRSIGKRSPALNARAVDIAWKMAAMPSRAARWNARGALKELTSPNVQEGLSRKKGGP